MKHIFLAFSAFIFSQSLVAQASMREHLLMDFGWRFAFGHATDAQQDFGYGTGYFSSFAKAGYGDGAAAAGFDDRSWRKLDLPHDWAVEQPFSQKASFSHGFKAIGRPFPERSIGWYRRHFSVAQADAGKRISVQFDGVFRASMVWVNGHYLGTQESGYNGFTYDISELLNYGGENTIAVRVDATMEEGWFYEGAGIYRHVWLNKTAPVHVAVNGTFVTTEQKDNGAMVTARVEVVNDGTGSKTVNVQQTIVDAEGKTITTGTVNTMQLDPFQTKGISNDLVIANAKQWELDAPYLYKLITTVNDGSKTIDRYETTFGVRTIRFDAKEGFFLNGKNVKLQGTNNHQDHAGVGTALPDELQYWRIRKLKNMGCNAYRCSHNPPAPELLDACDRMGMLVLDENRLMRADAEGLREMKRMIVRDRNHPSIIGWSIGNEEWAIENNGTGQRIATTLQAYVHSLDSTRPTAAGISGGFRSGIGEVLQVMGYNYLGNGDIDAHHQRLPAQPGMGTEEGSTFATRGIYITDDAKHYQSAYDKKPRPSFYSIEEGWKFYAERPYLAGLFIWTGFDYRGEPTPYGWPSVTSYFGMMDLCGFPKDNVFYLRSQWMKEPMVHLLPHWNWPGKEGQEIDVWTYSNCEEVELLLNKKSLGKKKLERYGHAEWKVPYAPGTLEAVGYKAGKKMAVDEVKTTGEPAAIQLIPHTEKLSANGEDLSIITVKAIDKAGLPVPVAMNEIHFSLAGPGRVIGVGNGDPTSLAPEKFIETIQVAGIEGLKEKAVDGFENRNETETVFNDANWKKAFDGRTVADSAKAYVYRGSFTLPQDFMDADVSFFYKSLGTEQSIFINGKQIAEKREGNKEGDAFVLDKTMLKPGINSIAIVAVPYRKKYEWEALNSDPGTIQLVTKPAAWKRNLFNGLAQVIVQTTKEAGELTLTASGEGLKSATIQFHVAAATSRPVVE